MFHRLIVIPQEEYMQLSRVQQVHQPLTQQMHNLEKQYEDQSQIKDPYAKLIHQGETLDEMKALKEKMRQSVTNTSPRPYAHRARTLFQSIQDSIKFNERGEIYGVTGNIIPESRLEDLIQYAIRDRRRPIQPAGWGEFLSLLKQENVPKHMLNRETINNIEGVKMKLKARRRAFIEPKSEPLSPTPKKTKEGKASKRTKSSKSQIKQRATSRTRRPPVNLNDFERY